MEPVLAALLFVLGVCAVIAAVKCFCLRATRMRLLEEEEPFTVFAAVRDADEAEYVVRSAMERVKWLDLYGMCRVVCLNESGDPEVEEILRRLVRRYPFAEIAEGGAPELFGGPSGQTRKNVL